MADLPRRGLGAGQAAGARGLPGAALPGVQQAGAALPAGQHRGRQVQKSHSALTKNENRAVTEEKKVIKNGSPFKSEFTVTKVRNQELLAIYAEMKFLHKMTSDGVSTEKAPELLQSYNELAARAFLIREDIKGEKGMALPVPKSLPKKLGP